MENFVAGLYFVILNSWTRTRRTREKPAGMPSRDESARLRQLTSNTLKVCACRRDSRRRPRAPARGSRKIDLSAHPQENSCHRGGLTYLTPSVPSPSPPMQDQEKLARLRRERKDAVREEVAARKELARLNNEARVLEVRSQLDAKLKDRNARRAELLRRESARVASDREARVAAAAERVATTAADRQNRARAAPTARAVPPVRPDPTRVDDDDARDARRLAFARRRRASRRDAAAADRAAARAAADARWDRVDETAAVDADERRRRRSSDASVSTTTETTDPAGRRRRGCRGGSHRDGRRDRETRRDVVVIPRETARSSGRGGRRGGEGGGGGGGGTRQGGLGGRGVALPAACRERPSKLAAARMRRDAAKAEAAAAAARANASIDASSLERKSAATTMQSAWRRRMARRAVALARVAAGSPRVPTRGVPTRGVPTRRSALVDESEGTALGEAGRELEREGSWSLEKVAGEVVVTPRGSRSRPPPPDPPGPGSAASARRSRGHTYSALGTFDTDSPFSRVDDDEVESKRSAWRGEVVSALGSREYLERRATAKAETKHRATPRRRI